MHPRRYIAARAGTSSLILPSCLCGGQSVNQDEPRRWRSFYGDFLDFIIFFIGMILIPVSVMDTDTGAEFSTRPRKILADITTPKPVAYVRIVHMHSSNSIVCHGLIKYSVSVLVCTEVLVLFL